MSATQNTQSLEDQIKQLTQAVLSLQSLVLNQSNAQNPYAQMYPNNGQTHNPFNHVYNTPFPQPGQVHRQNFGGPIYGSSAFGGVPGYDGMPPHQRLKSVKAGRDDKGYRIQIEFITVVKNEMAPIGDNTSSQITAQTVIMTQEHIESIISGKADSIDTWFISGNRMTPYNWIKSLISPTKTTLELSVLEHITIHSITPDNNLVIVDDPRHALVGLLDIQWLEQNIKSIPSISPGMVTSIMEQIKAAIIVNNY